MNVLLNHFTQPIIPWLFFVLQLDTSDKVNPIATTPIIEIIQEKIDKYILPWTFLKISAFFKKIPAPIDEPITSKIAEKKEIFLCFFVTVESWLLINFLLFKFLVLVIYNYL